MVKKHSKSRKSINIVKHEKVRKLWKWGLGPALIYFAFFVMYTWPWMAHFSSHFFTDNGDGLQNIWNVWWINKAAGLHQSLWHTQFLHHPFGVTLLGQTLNPFNGLVAIPLLKIFSLTQAFNIMVIFSFLAAGVTTFWLCYYFTKNYIASIIGGFIFTFSSYHFAHAIGHMQLISLEWIPLFILLWWRLLLKPKYTTAVGASFVLLLVLFCDYYYFLYSVMAAGLIFGYLWWKKEIPSLKKKQTFLPFLTFLGVSVLIVAPLPIALLRLNSREVLTGSHPAGVFSTDMLSTIITGGFWRFHILTDWYWHNIKGFYAETSVYVGLSVIVLMVIALIKRTKIHKYANFWLVLLVIFGIFSLGPRPMIFGKTADMIPMPYVLMVKIIPGMELSGMPIRMMVMVTLAAAVLSSMVLAKLDLNKTKHRVALMLFCLVLFLEMWPSPLYMFSNKVPEYVKALRSLGSGAVVDDAAPGATYALYNQTYHEHPIVLGYVSRTPKSLEDKDWQLVASILEHKYYRLCQDFHVRYYTLPANRSLDSQIYPVIYQDKDAKIYDLKNSPSC
jgi:hypothetical protein